MAIKIKLFVIFCLIAASVSCGAVPQRNADIVVTYEGALEHEAGPTWNSQEELSDALYDDKGPDIILFAASWCSACKTLEKTINTMKWRGEILVLNVDREWVKQLSQAVGVTSVPSVLITDDGGTTIAKIHSGVGACLKQIHDAIEKKRKK